MLKKIKVDIKEIRKAILEVDDEKLSVDDLHFISKQLPTAEEVVRLNDYGEPSKLAIADRYFCEVQPFKL
jgi:diaphanous 1